MLPSKRQRFLIAIAVVIGAAALLSVLPTLRAADGSSGVSLLSSRVNPLVATLIVAAAALPALIVGLMTSLANPLSGVFAITIALTVFAGVGGPITGWLHRSEARLPAEFGQLMIEVAIWQAGLIVMLLIIQRLRSPMRTRWPALAFSDHLGVDTQLRFPELQSLGAGLVCTAIGGGVSWLLLRTPATGQVIGALVLAFFLGGLFGHLVFPHTNPIGVLFSPAIVAIVSYAFVMRRFAGLGAPAVYEAFYSHKLLSTATALPVFYVSAGVAGCALGVGFAQGLISGDADATTTAAASAATPAGGAATATVLSALSERARELEEKRKREQDETK